MQAPIDDYSETYEFLLSLIWASPYGVIAIDTEGEITMINNRAIRFLGIAGTAEEITGVRLLPLIEAFPHFLSELKQCLTATPTPFNLEGLPYEEKFLTVRGRKIPNGMVITIEDVTELKEEETEALHAMMEGQELERKRLSKEIHDGLAPTLSTIKINLETLQAEQGRPDLNSKYEKLYDLIDTATSDMRSISHALMPKALTDFGLVAALQNLCVRVDDKYPVKIEFFYSDRSKERLDPVIELGMYRIGQELLNNAIKYARASKINVQLIEHAETVVLMVEDNGMGFNVDILETSDGIGLKNVETRTTALKGALIIDTQPNRGTLISVEVPLIQ